MRFRLIHLMGFTTLVCVALAIGGALGWYWPIALGGFALLGVALANCRRRPRLSLFAVWCAFVASLLIPAFNFSPPNQSSRGHVYGWQAAYVAANVSVHIFAWVNRLNGGDRMEVLPMPTLTCANAIVAVLPLWSFVWPRGRFVLSCATAAGASCAWYVFAEEKLESISVGFYLWATTLTVACVVIFLCRHAGRSAPSEPSAELT